MSRKGAELGPMLLLSVNRKTYMASLMTQSILKLRDLKSQGQGHQSLISRKGAELDPMLVINY